MKENFEYFYEINEITKKKNVSSKGKKIEDRRKIYIQK